MISQQRHKNDT